MNEQALIESKSLRESVIYRTDVLDKVKKLTMLPDDLHVTIDMAATYYEISLKTVESLIYDNREELESDGLRVVTGSSLSSFKKESRIKSKAASLTIIPRRAILRIGMLLKNSFVAQTVRNHLLDVEKSHRQGSEEPLTHFKKEVYFLEATAGILRLPESGCLKLLGDFRRTHKLNVPLPSYAVDECVTESATVLLKQHGANLRAARFNELLIQQGLMEERERPSKSGVKKFKSLTKTGLEYGKNIISPANPRETQPHYYANKFGQLLDFVGAGTA